MVAYGILYRFLFQSRNGWHFDIIISKLGYAGEMQRRALGRAPLLRRDNNAGIYGTSLEIYAECKVPSEYAQLYTSSAYEYRVEVVRNGQKLWSGFVTPELYEEPDRPAPYDVRIVATDGLGELKRNTFYSQGTRSLQNHLEQLLADTGIIRSITMVSALRYQGELSISFASALLEGVYLDLSHEDGNTCYDVLQRILSSINAGITLYNDNWLLFRETDIMRLATADGVRAYVNENEIQLPVSAFGSVKTQKWWPIGNLSAVVEPAYKSIQLTAPYNYSSNILAAWNKGGSAVYNSDEKAYELHLLNDRIFQTIAFSEDDPVEYSLLFKVKARSVGNDENGEREHQKLGISIKMNGNTPTAGSTYWLVEGVDREGYATGKYVWRNQQAQILKELEIPLESDTEKNAQEIEVVIPLYRKDYRIYAYAYSITVEVFNSDGAYPIYIYDTVLTKYDQADGHIADVIINNGARVKANDVNLHMTDGATVPTGGRWTMTSIPYLSTGQIIRKWVIDVYKDPEDYLAVMAQDYAQKFGSVRLRYSGKLNVPAEDQLPCLFVRDGIYYWPRVYIYDLYNDEMEVELISVPTLIGPDFNQDFNNDFYN